MREVVSPDGLNPTTEWIDIDEVRPHPDNPRQGDVGAICQSLEVHGQYRPIVVQRSSGLILAGNHTWRAAKALGWPRMQVTWIEVDDDQARRILLVDNRLSDIAAYDDPALAALLQEIAQSEVGLEGTGFDGDALDELLAEIDAANLLEPDRGDELAEALEGVGEPEHEVADGQVWRCGVHYVAVADLVTDWPLWVPLLDEGRLFVPYPSVWLLLTSRMADRPTLCVQPNHFLAGQLLDQWAHHRDEPELVSP